MASKKTKLKCLNYVRTLNYKYLPKSEITLTKAMWRKYRTSITTLLVLVRSVLLRWL